MIAAAQRSEAFARARPRRLQRSRRKGATTPEGARYVGRPTLFGNPFPIERFGHVRAVALHRRWLAFRLGALTLEQLGFSPSEVEALDRLRERVVDRLPEIAGVDLQCWCPLTSHWCHADTLLELANRWPTFSSPSAGGGPRER